MRVIRSVKKSAEGLGNRNADLDSPPPGLIMGKSHMGSEEEVARGSLGKFIILTCATSFPGNCHCDVRG